jgi:hypothetical protein
MWLKSKPNYRQGEKTAGDLAVAREFCQRNDFKINDIVAWYRYRAFARGVQQSIFIM